MGRSLYRQTVLAIQFATVVPTPQLADVTEDEVRRSMAWLPVLGAVLGALLWLMNLGLRRGLAAWPATVVSLAFYTISTGALHLDGLLDTADAVGSRARGERALAIMKDSRVGAMGVVTGCLVLLGKAAALSALLPQSPGPFIVIPALSRMAMLWAMGWAPAARSAGLAGLFARRMPVSVTWIGTVSACGLSVWLLSWREALFAILGVFAFAWGMTRWLYRRFGGLTGDSYGAINELIEWIGWTALTVHGC